MIPTQKLIVRKIQLALFANAQCQTGVVPKHVWFDDRGPHSRPEILCLLFAQDPYWGYCYGHVRATANGFVAYLIHLRNLISAETAHGVMCEFYMTMLRPQRFWLPHEGALLSTYIEAESFDRACDALVRLIERFDLEEYKIAWCRPADDRIAKIWRRAGPI
jgi:hypothetical protein